MTIEKEPFERDDLVTETYRELGVEKAPEHLNQRILRMASGDGGQSSARNFLFAAWMKPVAWAATIGLSLAIVLELSRVPMTPGPADYVPAAELIREEEAQQDTDAFEQDERPAAAKSEASRPSVSADESGRSTAAHDSVEIFSREPKGTLDTVAAPAQSSQVALPATTETSAAKERVVDPPAVRQRLTDLPAQSKRMADIAGPSKPAADGLADSQTMAAFALSAEQSDADDFCDVSVRLSEETWLACIENLRRSGSEEAADREYEAFILEYPVESHGAENNK